MLTKFQAYVIVIEMFKKEWELAINNKITLAKTIITPNITIINKETAIKHVNFIIIERKWNLINSIISRRIEPILLIIKINSLTTKELIILKVRIGIEIN